MRGELRWKPSPTPAIWLSPAAKKRRAVARIVELAPLELLERVGFPRRASRASDRRTACAGRRRSRSSPRPPRRLRERLERPDPRVHVRHRDDPVEVVIVVRVGSVGQAKFLAPALVKLPQKKSLIGTRSGSSCRNARFSRSACGACFPSGHPLPRTCQPGRTYPWRGPRSAC